MKKVIGRRDTQPRKKPGYQLPEALVLAVKDAVEQGAAVSQNAFVERALVRELEAIRHRRLEMAYDEAASDPAFCEDMRSITTAYDSAAGDGLKRPVR